MSNIVIRKPAPIQENIICDVLEGEILHFCKNGVFTGTVDDDVRAAVYTDGLEDGSVQYPIRKTTTISGIQRKIACHLSITGELSLAIGKSTTHIVKPPPRHRK